ncbi:RNA-dependent RNA polymerase 6 [Vitis vinifera]|uniref:RNA-dependent RNA polymerase n=1 Tax=Vitis vinifera TaxID=29760 RepID=A0A438F263_VITVI|nr:RNA-dependent RNA polymerase 6 [Vitis vinifera]
MNKFLSDHTILEICSWTRFQPGFLNRQIVTLLSALNVPDKIFWKMQESMISKLNQMLTDTDVAFDVLIASCAEQGNTAAIMLSAGFKPQTEPHLQGMLTCIRAAQFWGLREKARIFVPSGRWLMGCLDELGVLEQGPVLYPAKNPCLHPGDVRILEAVDAPGLEHLVDCLVFPQKGDRPHSNEASGSDLDGDLYFVTWEETLIPPSKQSWPPMQYDSAEAKALAREVTSLVIIYTVQMLFSNEFSFYNIIKLALEAGLKCFKLAMEENHATVIFVFILQDIIDFFTKNMVNENLGAICNAHVVHADRSEYGALDEACLDLAERAATAVDFLKLASL